MTLRTIPLSRIKRGQRVLVRIDANVPLVNGRISKGGAWRLEQVVEYLHALSKRGAVVVVCSHLGRPDGKRIKALSLAPVARWLKRVGKVRSTLAPGITGPKVVTMVEHAKPGDVVVLENLRFDAREEQDDKQFAKELASLADMYINNAFGTCHRKHASVHTVTTFLPSYAGPLIVKEVKGLSAKRRKPFMLVMGGMKLKTKMPVLERLAPEAEAVLTGGGIALTLQAARDRQPITLNGKQMGMEELRLARRAMKVYGDRLVLPIDYVVGNGRRVKIVWADELGSDDVVIDTGPKTREQYSEYLKGAKTIIWNGAMGIVEERAAQAGTMALTKSISAQKKAVTILGGGDTISFLRNKGLAKGFTHLSTGGGAMLVFLGGGQMPGLDVLKK